MTRAPASPSPSREGWLTETELLEGLRFADTIIGPVCSMEVSKMKVAFRMALSALRPAGDEGLHLTKRIKAALTIIEAEGCDCDAEFRDEHTCLAGRIENALAPLPAAPKSPADGRK